MRQIFVLLSFVSIVAGLIWWLVVYEKPEKEAVGIESRAEDWAKDKVHIIESNDKIKENEEVRQKEGVIEIPFPEESMPKEVKSAPVVVKHAIDSASEREKKYTVDMRKWLKDLRVFLEHIQIARLLTGGAPQRELMEEGAAPIDLHKEYKKVFVGSENLVTPSSCSEALPIVREIHKGLEEIIGELSDEPTLEELESVEPKRVELVFTINDLYKIINSYCQG